MINYLMGVSIMVYMGSKRRIAKHIIPIMIADRKPDQYWIEPFVGGGNVIDKITGNRIDNRIDNRIGADINKYTIGALKSIIDKA